MERKHAGDNTDQLLDSDQVAKLVGCHKRSVSRMAANGQMPKSLKIGKLKRWSLKTITAWIDAGCPSQQEAAK